MTTKDSHSRQWLERAAGQQLDALEDALTALREDDAHSRHVLHRQLQRIEAASRKAGFTGAAAMARQANTAGSANVRPFCNALTALLRAAIRSARSPEDRTAADLDVPQIALCSNVGNCALHRLQPRHAPAGTLILRIENLESIRQRFGEEGVEQARTQVLRALRNMLRTGDCLATTNGHCFVVFLPGEDAFGLRSAFERMRAALLRMTWTGGLPASEGLQIGLCGAPAGVMDAEDSQPVPEAEAARVAVVTNSPSFSRVLSPVLAPVGCVVSQSGAPGTETWAALKRQPPRIVLVDVPTTELVKSIDALADALRGRRIPIVALVENEDAAAVALEHGVRAALRKPVRPDELLSTFRRLARRGGAEPEPVEKPPEAGSRILVASDSISQLIAIGTSLHKRIGGDIRLCRGLAEAGSRAQEHNPHVVVLDLKIGQPETVSLLKTLGARMPAPRIVLIADENDHAALSIRRLPGIAELIHKPVSLLQLPERIAKAAGLLPSAPATSSFDSFRAEIQRLVARV